MKSTLKICAIFSFLIVFSYTQAQVSFGVKAGLNLSKFHTDSPDGEDFESKIKPGFHIGAVADISLGNILSLQPGLLFSSKGASSDLEENMGNSVSNVDGYDRFTFYYVELPVNVVYKIQNIRLLAGPYVAIGIEGKNKWDFSYTDDILGRDYDFEGDEDISLEFGTISEEEEANLDEPALNALDYGVNLGVGYQAGPILVNIGYSIGLENMNLLESERDDYKIKNRVLSLSLSYFLE